MCGLTGYHYLDSQEESSSKSILDMIALQEHRGPDDSGIVGINTIKRNHEDISVKENSVFDQPKNLFFGFNRLSILDLSEMGHQPMISLNEEVILMMNGEIYNAFDYKDELVKKGYQFKSTSDTEVVLHLYTEYGIDGMIRRLNGMFAFAIYDFKLDTLYLVRDRFGIKPLYILHEPNRIAFASELKSFRGLVDFKFEADFTRLDEFLLFRNVVNNTMFKNIYNCAPGSYLTIKKNVVKKHVYYDVNLEGEQKIKNSKAKEILEKTLQKSVVTQMISDVKLGCQLSGGVDSSLITYYASKALKKGKLETISVIFKDSIYSEEKYIDVVAEKLSLKAHKFEIDAYNYLEALEKAIWHFEHPLNHPNTIAIYLLSQEAKKHVTVLLSGEGADETLAGYSRFLRAQKSKIFSKSFFSGLKRNSKYVFDYLGYSLNAEKRMIMESASGTIGTARALKPDFELNNAIDERNSIFKKLKGSIDLKQRKYEILTFLPDLLMRQDKMSMAHSIENRVPFLDNDMVATSLSVSGEVLIANYHGKIENKKVLKDICADKFEETFAYRDKMGFGIPLRSFMTSNVFQERWKNHMEPDMQRRGLFKVSTLSFWVKNISKSKPEEIDAIWLMMCFEIWAQQYLD